MLLSHQAFEKCRKSGQGPGDVQHGRKDSMMPHAQAKQETKEECHDAPCAVITHQWEVRKSRNSTPMHSRILRTHHHLRFYPQRFKDCVMGNHRVLPNHTV